MKDNQAEPFFQSDLFALTHPKACAVCGGLFDVPISRPRGRPQKFCGDVCRKTALQRQKNAWALKQKSGGRDGR